VAPTQQRLGPGSADTDFEWLIGEPLRVTGGGVMSPPFSGGSCVIDVEDDQGCGDYVADAPGIQTDVAQGFEGGFNRLLPRSPTARSRLCARLNVCCISVSRPFLGFLNATTTVSASPS
jgi:hypothetical protein